MLFYNGVYYWFGESRGIRAAGDTRRWIPMPGVACYASTDLRSWKNGGLVLETPQNDPLSEIRRGCTIERPKVIFNSVTKKFVMWFHLENARGYSAAKCGLAISDSPSGPYKYLKSFRPGAQSWPIGYPEEFRTPLTSAQVSQMMSENRRQSLRDGVYARRDFAAGQMSRDMTIFQDEDGKAYLITSSEENFTIHLHELTDDYLDFTGNWIRILPGEQTEAPAMVKRDGKYFLFLSSCTGWDANTAHSATADSIWGPWKSTGNPCVGNETFLGFDRTKTFGGQSTWIMPHPTRSDEYIAMFDLWRPGNLASSGHLWLPLVIENGKMVVRWSDEWKR